MSTLDGTKQSTLFEVPNLADVHPVKERKHFSIDLSLELERQLEMDSNPVTPMRDLYSAVEDTEQKHEALDPEILAHLVMQLRHSLSEITKERDELAKLLADSHNKEASLNDALQLMTEKATSTNEELDIARRKNKDDEEAIALLRVKVEESRRGLMRLQTENRRQSMAPIDVNRASLLNVSGTPSSNKRASFTPMTGRSTSNSHRRISSVSDLAFAISDFQPSPSGQALTFPDPANPMSKSPPSTSVRHPTIFGRHSPPNSNEPGSPVSDLEDVRRDVRRLKDELETAKHELAEAHESREASETCVRALRQFIAENSFGESSALQSSIKLPPPPTMTTGAEGDTQAGRPTAGGWGFKLWGGDSPRAPSTAGAQASSLSSPLTHGPAPLPTAPINRKFGGFFSSRSSISSTGSGQIAGTLSPLQTNASIMKRNVSHETTSSDASSTLEPISPSDDIHGLGNGAIIVRDVTNLSDVGRITLKLQPKTSDEGHVHGQELEVIR